MVTIKDIAERLGISISTVSKGLHGASDISEEMRQQVLDTAIEMGYIIKEKKPATRQKVCIIVENMEYANINQFGYELIAGFRLVASEAQFEVDIVPIDQYFQTWQTYDSLMKQNGYSGAFFLGLELNEIYMKQLEKTTIPTVLFDNYISNEHIAYVGTDIHVGFSTLIRYLKENGHRKIAFLNGSKNSYISALRYQGFIQAMNEAELDLDMQLIGHTVYYPDETVADFVKGFTGRGATAIMCASDLIAARTINELHKLGLRVPEDVSVTGFDDLPVAKYLAPPLTTIRQERFALGKSAFSLLKDLMSGLPVSTMLLHSTVVLRESVGKAPNQANWDRGLTPMSQSKKWDTVSDPCPNFVKRRKRISFIIKECLISPLVSARLLHSKILYGSTCRPSRTDNRYPCWFPVIKAQTLWMSANHLYKLFHIF